MNQSLEHSLREIEEQLEIAAKSADLMIKALRKARKGALLGNLADLNKGLAEGRSAAKRCSDEMAAADSLWQFEPEPYLSSGEYWRELTHEAERSGLKLFVKDDRGYCFPMLLTLSSRDNAVLIDRKPERRIRPGELVKILAERQKKPMRFHEQKLIDLIFKAYSHLAPRLSSGWTEKTRSHGPVVSLRSVHELLTIMEKSYSLEEFARDIYLLDRQPELRTRDSRRFALPAATAAKVAGAQLPKVIDEQGREKTYVGIRFDKD